MFDRIFVNKIALTYETTLSAPHVFPRKQMAWHLEFEFLKWSISPAIACLTFADAICRYLSLKPKPKEIDQMKFVNFHTAVADAIGGDLTPKEENCSIELRCRFRWPMAATALSLCSLTST